jgi:hypothetical protein
MRGSTLPAERKLAERLMKAAAAVDAVTRAKGSYSARPKEAGTEDASVGYAVDNRNNRLGLKASAL